MVVSLRDRPAALRQVRRRARCRGRQSPAPHFHSRRRLPHTQPEGWTGNERIHAGHVNLGWKLSSVLLGRCAPKLLHTYSAERQAIAKELIDFDREWAKMLSAPLKSLTDDEGVEPTEVQRYFVKHGHYTAGTATMYKPSLISAGPGYQHLAKGLVIGMRFHSAPVVRLADAKPVRLGDMTK